MPKDPRYIDLLALVGEIHALGTRLTADMMALTQALSELTMGLRSRLDRHAHLLEALEQRVAALEKQAR